MTLPAGTPSWLDGWMRSARAPLVFATEVMGFLPPGVPNPNGHHQLEKWQADYLRDFYLGPDGKPVDDPRHSVRAGHGVGKGCLISILALWFVFTHYDAKCVMTANTENQLRDNNAPELRKWAAKLPAELRDQIQIDIERVYMKAAPEMAFVVYRTASKSNPEALQGIHAKHVLYLIDEASGIEDIVFEVAQGSLSTAGAMACLFSNPTRNSGFFFDTHHKLRHRWKTWRVNCEDVPRARGHIQDVIDSYGKDSNKYRVRVLGDFPTADDDVVIPLAWLEAARKRDVATFDVLPTWGLDVARFGEDSSALAKRKGNRLLEPVAEWRNLDIMQVAGRVLNEWKLTEEALRPSAIFVDVIGLGAGVVDRLKEMELPVVGINVGESAASDEKFQRLRDELWWKGREWFGAKDCVIADDEALIAELTGPTYDYSSNGKIVVESKRDMKKRGIKSPNRADAFLLTLAMPDRRRARVDRYKPSPSTSSWAA
jgi:phage terminase large subunit